VDKAGIRVGVSQGSTSQAALTRQLRNAVISPAALSVGAGEMLYRGEIDTFATNKGILFELADELRGARVLDGRWGLEQLAIAIPKGRDAGMDYVRKFADDVKADGQVRRATERAGLRGTVDAAPR
jgi:polar amino acid transport system substrate-binding protein